MTVKCNCEPGFCYNEWYCIKIQQTQLEKVLIYSKQKCQATLTLHSRHHIQDLQSFPNQQAILERVKKKYVNALKTYFSDRHSSFTWLTEFHISSCYHSITIRRIVIAIFISVHSLISTNITVTFPVVGLTNVWKADTCVHCLWFYQVNFLLHFIILISGLNK